MTLSSQHCTRIWSGLVLLLWCSSISLAQPSARINQVFLNPFAYNPAYLGDEGYVEASLSRRQQWVGLVGAPITNWFTFQVPTDHRVAMGLNVVDNRYGPLATTSALATFGYSVPFSEKSYLRFGLSGGLGTRRTDLSKFDDPNDPMVSAAYDQRSYLDGSFGIHYRYANFSAGASLPRLFGHSLVSRQTRLEARLSKFNHFIAQAGYKLTFPMSHWSLHSQALYHINGQVRQAEGLLVASYRNIVWGGASYRQSDIWTSLVGLRLYERAKVGYAYELASLPGTFGATHELTLHWQFGRKRKINEPGDARMKRRERQVKNFLSRKPQPKLSPAKADPLASEPVTGESDIEERVEHVAASSNSDDLAPGNYVVVGTFGSEQNARQWERKLKQQGYVPQYGYSSAKGYYYVYLENSATLSVALQRVKKLHSGTSLKDSWVLVIQD